jgi:hypothetical protein
MTGKHFSNTGQLLQLIVATVSLIIAGVNAYPSIQSLHFFDSWPLLFYILVIASAFALPTIIRPATTSIPEQIDAKQLSTAPAPGSNGRVTFEVAVENARLQAKAKIDHEQWLNRLPIDGNLIKVQAGASAFKLRLGERKVIATGMNRLSLELRGVKTSEDEKYADLSVESFIDTFQGGSNVKPLDRKRFLVPRSGSVATYTALFSLSFSQDSLDIDLIRVDHINEHLGEVDVTIVRCFPN